MAYFKKVKNTKRVFLLFLAPTFLPKFNHLRLPDRRRSAWNLFAGSRPSRSCSWSSLGRCRPSTGRRFEPKTFSRDLTSERL